MDASVDQAGTTRPPSGAEGVDQAASSDVLSSESEGVVASRTDIVEAAEGILIVQDHRVRFQYTGSNELVDLPTDQVRRVQIDFELGRPATVAIVPNSGTLDVRLLTVEPRQFEQLAAVMVHLGVDIAEAKTP